MNKTMMGLGVMSLALATTGCSKLKDVLDGENDSYCESVCDWATACVDGYTTSMTSEEAYAACIAATEAEDKSCGGAEDELSVDDALLLNECTADQLAQDCAALTGEQDEIVKGTPPKATCMIAYGNGSDSLVAAAADLPNSVTELNDIQVYKTYNVARNAVLDSGAVVCERFEETMCGHMTDCLIEKGGIDVGEEIEQATTDACIESLFGGVTDSCISSGQWDSIIPIDYNPARYSAEQCMDGLDATAASGSSCDVFTGAPPAICAGAWATNPEQVESILSGAISFAGGYDVDL